MNPFDGGWFIVVSFIVAFVLTVFQLPAAAPEFLAWLRPSWVAIVLFFWVLAVPHRVGLIVAWLIGFGLDVLLDNPLGLNGFILALLTYVTWRFHERLRMWTILQQGSVLFVLLLVGEVLRGTMLVIVDGRDFPVAALLVALSSALIWPAISMLLDRLQRQVGVR
ncbi:MAG: rod shape-determining protein MreD [Pseudomonadaceae bacterium]|nr:rod shape-determining protein MreD [Pseudomonadaceae bacterium]